MGLRWETNHLRDTFVRLILLPSALHPYFSSSSSLSSLCSFAVNQIHGAFPHTEFFIFSLLSFENALIRIYEMKAEVCLRLRLVCPIVSLPLSLSLPLFLSFILASISLSSSVCVASFARLRSRFFTVTSFRYRPIDLNIFVLTLPFCEAGGYRRVPDAPRIGVNDRFYEASLGLLAQLPSRNDRRWSWGSSSSRKLPQVENSRNFAPGTSRDFLVHFSRKTGATCWG